MTTRGSTEITDRFASIETSETVRAGSWSGSVAAGLIARLASGLSEGCVTVRLPDGRSLRLGKETAALRTAHIEFRRWRGLFRTFLKGDVGFAEAYMDGDCVCDDLDALFALMLANRNVLDESLRGTVLSRALQQFAHRRNANTRAGSRRNIAAHYDLGNGFYSAWLDRAMIYSSGLFSSDNDDLESAQEAKLALVAEMAGIEPGDKVLEIGCGWGGFARHVKRKFEASVHGITLSAEQLAHALSAAKDAASPTFSLTDYRDVDGTYDRVASIEMFEAVGEEHWPQFFSCVRDRLRPGGTAAIQVITIDDGRFDSYRARADFIQRYIFPGGMLPSPERFRAAAGDAGLRVEDERFFGLSYARTLSLWKERFDVAWPRILDMGFDQRFYRMWTYYLDYCRAGFETGLIDVGVFRLARPN